MLSPQREPVQFEAYIIQLTPSGARERIVEFEPNLLSSDEVNAAFEPLPSVGTVSLDKDGITCTHIKL